MVTGEFNYVMTAKCTRNLHAYCPSEQISYCLPRSGPPYDERKRILNATVPGSGALGQDVPDRAGGSIHR